MEQVTHANLAAAAHSKLLAQVIMAILIFSLLGSVAPEGDRTRADEVRNGLFSTISFVLGAITSILSGFLGMKIATYANARTALEARKGIAPAFMCGTYSWRPISREVTSPSSESCRAPIMLANIECFGSNSVSSVFVCRSQLHVTSCVILLML